MFYKLFYKSKNFFKFDKKREILVIDKKLLLKIE